MQLTPYGSLHEAKSRTRGREPSKGFDPTTAMAIFSRLWELFYIFLLLINAVAILNEERFLARSELTWLFDAL